MRATFKLNDVDKVEASMTITMRLGQWRELKEQIQEVYPGWQFRSKIAELIDDAEKHFYATQESE